MSEETVVREVKDNTGNPAPLGLMGFGMTTVLLNLHNAGWFELGSMVLAMGLFYGGLAQVFAGVMEWKKKNTFACTAFTSYGMFWLILVSLLVMPKIGFWEKTSTSGMVAFLIMWGIFTGVMFIGTLRLSKALQVVFGSLAILFFLLAAGDITDDPTLKTFTGYEGIFCGASAMYTGLGQVLNEVYGRTVLPLGPVDRVAKN
jgi:succinate-acetate transporter protein